MLVRLYDGPPMIQAPVEGTCGILRPVSRLCPVSKYSTITVGSGSLRSRKLMMLLMMATIPTFPPILGMVEPV